MISQKLIAWLALSSISEQESTFPLSHPLEVHRSELLLIKLELQTRALRVFLLYVALEKKRWLQKNSTDQEEEALFCILLLSQLGLLLSSRLMTRCFHSQKNFQRYSF